MVLFFFILVIIASAILGFFVLIQNPKGGGLSGNIGGFGNQFMGVKQTTDVLEKGTWIFAAVIGVLCLISVIFFKGAGNGATNDNSILKNLNTNAPVQQTAPAQSAPAQNTAPAPAAPAK
ncbi:preprotein translocase subunit SecG [Rhizosphaericola mali]|uniref:Protein-export membrane protein SecG n=1 Tax=Rhizosphaericola mali TaxID=2545455 RepID=A0A5P2G4J0_9BACT|nr:preprotein translocase subunit SecG [Rhizosphaericola mali]QES90746.1 preprotein translocase subunit SecG [Rhizosphaericola mali]